MITYRRTKTREGFEDFPQWCEGYVFESKDKLEDPLSLSVEEVFIQSTGHSRFHDKECVEVYVPA